MTRPSRAEAGAPAQYEDIVQQMREVLLTCLEDEAQPHEVGKHATEELQQALGTTRCTNRPAAR